MSGPIPPYNGGTGIDNGTNTIKVNGGTLEVTLPSNVSYTLPASGSTFVIEDASPTFSGLTITGDEILINENILSPDDPIRDIFFQSLNGDSNIVTFAQIEAINQDAAAGNETANLKLSSIISGILTDFILLNGGSNKINIYTDVDFSGSNLTNINQLEVFQSILLSAGGSAFETINSSTTGSANEAGLKLSRGDQANGFSRVWFQTAGSTKWTIGMRTATNNFSFRDETNNVNTLDITPGTSGNGILAVSGKINASNDITINTGDLIVNTAGKGLKVKQGSNATAGTGAVLVGGTVTVNTTAVNTGDIVIPTCTSAGGVQGIITVSITNGTSFTLTSSSLTDTSTYAWVIIKSA